MVFVLGLWRRKEEEKGAAERDISTASDCSLSQVRIAGEADNTRAIVGVFATIRGNSPRQRTIATRTCFRGPLATRSHSYAFGYVPLILESPAADAVASNKPITRVQSSAIGSQVTSVKELAIQVQSQGYPARSRL